MNHQPKVIFTDTGKGIREALCGIFEPFGGPGALLKESRDVYIKVNAVDSRDTCFTDPGVIAEAARLFKENGARNVYVMENCTQGNFTRLVFAASGILSACRAAGARTVCLDETGAVPVYLKNLDVFVDISAFVHEHLIRDREKNLHVSLPKLKTHSMTGVTLAVKNQFGFVHQQSRIADHNFRLHQKLADLYELVRPDFVVVDGTRATNHGHYIAQANIKECVKDLNVLIGGADPLAVDLAAGAFLGYAPDRVEHLRLALKAREQGLSFEDLEISGRELFEERRQSFTHELLDRFPEDLVILRGEDRCCPEGCRRNTETLAEVLFCDYQGRGGFTILMGKGIPGDRVARVTGRAHLAGNCAIEDHEADLVARLGRGNVTRSAGCNNLADSVTGLCRQMGVSPIRLAQTGPLTSLRHLVSARLHGTRALIPKLF